MFARSDKKALLIINSVDFVLPALVGSWITADLPLKTSFSPSKCWEDQNSLIKVGFKIVGCHFSTFKSVYFGKLIHVEFLYLLLTKAYITSIKSISR